MSHDHLQRLDDSFALGCLGCFPSLQYLLLHHHPLLHQAGGPSGHPPLHNLPGAFPVRLEANLHDLHVASMRPLLATLMTSISWGPSQQE
jgi:hypothetical protein